MGLSETRGALITALKTGNVEHEARDALSEKNLLAIGAIAPEFVIRLLQRTRGDQYTRAPHDWNQQVVVHIFRPVVGEKMWYVKAYFLEESSDRAVFISVHEVG